MNTVLNERYFVSYTGIKLPLKLVNEIEKEGLHTRNTYYCGWFDNEDKLIRCQKIVYGEIETEHLYHYDENGVLKQADITEEDETNSVYFAEK